jgi:hypothetical protein
MQDALYADAIKPARVNILKLPLRDYSLGHELLLLRERNPFLMQTPFGFSQLPMEQRIFALHRATWICSNTHQQNEGESFVWFKLKQLRFLRRKLTMDDYALAAAEFWNYLNAGRGTPRLSKRRQKSGEEAGRPFGAPILPQLFQFVLTLPEIKGQKVNAAWDYPFSAAIWRYFVHLEMEGSIQIENADEEETRLKVEQFEREYAEEQEALKEKELCPA